MQNRNQLVSAVISIIMEVFNKDYVRDAAFLLHHVNDIHFSTSSAIFAVTADKSLATGTIQI